MANGPTTTPGHEVVEFEHRMTAVDRDKRCMEQLHRRACTALFYLLGREHPLYQH